MPSGLAERYVKALSGLELKGSTLEKLGKEISAVADLYNSGPAFRDLLENPAFADAEKKSVLANILQERSLLQKLLLQKPASPICQNFLFLLIDKKRTKLLPEIASGLQHFIDAQAGVARAKLTSASPLTKQQVDKLTASLAEIVGRPVRVSTEVAGELIGGVVIEMEGRVFDGSIKRHLFDIQERLLKDTP